MSVTQTPTPNAANPDRVTRDMWMSLGGAFAGWTLDAMDWMLLALSLPLIEADFHVSLRQVALLATLTLFGAAVGGTLMGIIADYFGRVRTLMLTMILYGVFTAACGVAQTFNQLLILRVLCGFGLGGEWGVGATLVSEYWPDKYRAKCTSFVHSGWPVGYGLATLAYMWVTPHWGWRGLFFIGIIPAIIAIWFRTAVPEPEAWKESHEKRTAAHDAHQPAPKFPLTQLFSRSYIRVTLLGGVLASGALMAYWGSATWLPSYLAKARGLNIVKTAGFLIFLNAGAFLGYQFFGWLADKHGRRLSFTLGMFGSIIVTLAYVMMGSEKALLYFGPIFGFVSYGFFGPFGAFISELFPAESRATGTTLVFNIGRCASMASPYIIGALAETRGLGFGLGATVVFNLVGLIALFLLPETVKAGVRMYHAGAANNTDIQV